MKLEGRVILPKGLAAARRTWNATWWSIKCIKMGIHDTCYTRWKSELVYHTFVKDGRVVHCYTSRNLRVTTARISYPI